MTTEFAEEDLYSTGCRMSLVRLLNNCREITDEINKLPVEYHDLTEKDLRKMARANETDELLRVSFWREYRRAKTTSSLMKAMDIYGGICMKQTFYKKIRTPLTLAFIICPSKDEIIVQEEMLALAYRKMRQILAMPLYEPVFDRSGNKTGKRPNTSLMKLQIDIANKLEDRLKGSVVQRQQIEARTLTVQAKPESLVGIEAQIEAIKALEAKGKIEEAEVTLDADLD